ncbi:LysM peptidoglycan-binding domain-containing protein, partial [Pseudooceanicola sp.]|uniref:LysM peptidoglycan-binding domain-containing protein n=1 Tax=Pseudooceanicola sp. TaxID=1914328 RepID=UPI0035125DF8
MTNIQDVGDPATWAEGRSPSMQFRSLVASVLILFTTQPAHPHEDILHQVQKGDTLWDLAQKYLGDGRGFSQIFRENARSISNPDLIVEGQTISIPDTRTDNTIRATNRVGATEPGRLFDLEEGLRDGLEVGLEDSVALKIALGMIEVPNRIEIVSFD